jgi:receptor-binding and translocation channel-forming TcA subunit of Tc toxin
VSLANINPVALIELRETGTCTVHLPEALFDLDRPGDYGRRIKMVSLSLPCVTGPYTGVNCTMTLLSSQIRTTATPVKPYQSTGPTDPRFAFVASVESVVTSSARDDSGMFLPDMRDERFLPFEGAGVIGTWRLELPSRYRQFDYQTISDAVITIRYTGLDGGQPLRDSALADLDAALKSMEVGQGRKGLFKLLSARHDYPDQWYQMLQPAADPPAVPTFTGVILFRTIAYGAGDTFIVKLTPPVGASLSGPVQVVRTEFGGLPAAVFEFGPAGVRLDPTKPWTVEVTALPAALGQEVPAGPGAVTRFNPNAVEDFGMLLGYRLDS